MLALFRKTAFTGEGMLAMDSSNTRPGRCKLDASCAEPVMYASLFLVQSE